MNQSNPIDQIFILTNHDIPLAWRDNYTNQILSLGTAAGSYRSQMTPLTHVTFAVVGEIDFSDEGRVFAGLLVSGQMTDPPKVDRMTFGKFDDGRGLRGCVVAQFRRAS
jgi:hypothetical protein